MKPIIEVLAGIPSVVVGYFALRFIAPELVEPFFNPDDDAEHARGRPRYRHPRDPDHGHDFRGCPPGGTAVAARSQFGIGGAKKSNTVIRVVLPAAVSGIVAAFIIATSREIGETLVATMAGG